MKAKDVSTQAKHMQTLLADCKTLGCKHEPEQAPQTERRLATPTEIQQLFTAWAIKRR